MAGDENTPGGEKPAPEAPQYVTKEDVAAMVTGALTRQMKPFTAGFEQFKASFPELLQEALKGHKPEPAPESADGARKPDPEVAALKQKLLELEKANQAERTKREAAEERARLDGGKSALKNALLSQVRPEMVDVVTDLLFDARKKVTFDDQGRPLFSIKTGALDEDTPMPLTDGVSHWLKSDEAKHFLPAPAPESAQRGTPAPQSRTQPFKAPQYDKPARTDEEKARRALEREQAFNASQRRGQSL
jgi:hypothetical protein